MKNKMTDKKIALCINLRFKLLILNYLNETHKSHHTIHDIK